LGFNGTSAKEATLCLQVCCSLKKIDTSNEELNMLLGGEICKNETITENTVFNLVFVGETLRHERYHESSQAATLKY